MRRLLNIMLFCITVLALAVSVSAADVMPSVELDNGVEIKLTNDDLFLPSCVDPGAVKIKFGSTHQSIVMNGKSVKSGDLIDITPFGTTDRNGNKFYKVKFETEDEIAPNDVIYVYIADTAPAVFISTLIGSSMMIGSNISDSDATVVITDNGGPVLLSEGEFIDETLIVE